VPDEATPAFIPGATLRAFISLNDADEVSMSTLNQSLCVLLTGSSDGGFPERCPVGGQAT
jgi:hypothetical protein